MKWNIHVRGFELSENSQNAFIEKLRNLDNYFEADDSKYIDVIFEFHPTYKDKSSIHSVDISYRFKDTYIHAHVDAESSDIAFDKSFTSFKTQVLKEVDKLKAKRYSNDSLRQGE